MPTKATLFDAHGDIFPCICMYLYTYTAHDTDTNKCSAIFVLVLPYTLCGYWFMDDHMVRLGIDRKTEDEIFLFKKISEEHHSEFVEMDKHHAFSKWKIVSFVQYFFSVSSRLVYIYNLFFFLFVWHYFGHNISSFNDAPCTILHYTTKPSSCDVIEWGGIYHDKDNFFFALYTTSC